MILRGAIIGFGFISENGHLPAYLARSDKFRIVAVADRCAARRERARLILPDARIYEDHESLLAGEAGKLDFVDITTPPASHAQIAHAAFEQGLHVLCEKPLATTTVDAAGMLDHARRARCVLFPGHNYKHAPVVRTVREILSSGRIGEVRLVTLDTFRTTHAKGVREWLPDWRRHKQYSGGGIAMDHGSHTFYLAFEWLKSYPTAITAKATRLSEQHDTEDNFSCTLTFPTGVAMAKLTWNAGFRKVIYTLHGERGAIKIEDDEIEVTVQSDKGPLTEKHAVPSRWMDAGHAGWFQSLLADFLSAIENEVFVGDDARESLLCVQLIETAYSSARNGSAELSVDSNRALVAIA